MGGRFVLCTSSDVNTYSESVRCGLDLTQTGSGISLVATGEGGLAGVGSVALNSFGLLVLVTESFLAGDFFL